MMEGNVLRRERPSSLQVFPRGLLCPSLASCSFSGPGGSRCFLTPHPRSIQPLHCCCRGPGTEVESDVASGHGLLRPWGLASLLACHHHYRALGMDGVTEARARTELGKLRELSKIKTKTPKKNNKNVRLCLAFLSANTKSQHMIKSGLLLNTVVKVPPSSSCFPSQIHL